MWRKTGEFSFETLVVVLLATGVLCGLVADGLLAKERKMDPEKQETKEPAVKLQAEAWIVTREDAVGNAMFSWAKVHMGCILVFISKDAAELEIKEGIAPGGPKMVARELEPLQAKPIPEVKP